MKQAILLHGTAGSDKDYFWFADTKRYLVEHGYKVWWPLLPGTKKPKLEPTLRFVLNNMPAVDEKTVIIGHSSACPLILSVLENIQVTIRQAILVSGYYAPLDSNFKLMLQENYNWKRIKFNAKEIILINSENDPWGCNYEQALPVAEQLEAKMLINHGEGHMGSTAYNQPYEKFGLVKRLIIK